MPIPARDQPDAPRYSRRTALTLAGGAVLGLVVAGCGGDDEPETGADSPTEDLNLERAVVEFTIVARSSAWDRDRFVVPAGQQVTATIDNRDPGIPHNLHVKSPGDPKTELQEGPVTQTLRFTIDTAGDYGFVCDAHPNMTGTIVAI